VIQAVINLKGSLIKHEFQLVNKQIDIPCDEILGRDFLRNGKAQICYEIQCIKFNGEVIKMVNAKQPEIAKTERGREARKMLPRRSEGSIWQDC
jgi:hypothetical protein